MHLRTFFCYLCVFVSTHLLSAQSFDFGSIETELNRSQRELPTNRDISTYSKTKMGEYFFWRHQNYRSTYPEGIVHARYDTIGKVNGYFQSLGYKFYLSGSGNQHGFTSIVQRAIQWQFKGAPTTMYFENKAYSAFDLTNGLTFYENNGITFCRISTKHNEFFVYLMFPKRKPRNQSELLAMAQKGTNLSNAVKNTYFTTARVPMIHFKGYNNNDWSKSLVRQYDNKTYKTLSARSYHELMVKEEGENTPVPIGRKEVYSFNQNFLFIIKKEDSKGRHIHAAYYVTSTFWSNPGDMSKLLKPVNTVVDPPKEKQNPAPSTNLPTTPNKFGIHRHVNFSYGNVYPIGRINLDRFFVANMSNASGEVYRILKQQKTQNCLQRDVYYKTPEGKTIHIGIELDFNPEKGTTWKNADYLVNLRWRIVSNYYQLFKKAYPKFSEMGIDVEYGPNFAIKFMMGNYEVLPVEVYTELQRHFFAELYFKNKYNTKMYHLRHGGIIPISKNGRVFRYATHQDLSIQQKYGD